MNWKWTIALCLVLLPSIACAEPAAERGKAVYDANCAACHGAKGDGLGTLAEYCSPRPRDFVKGVYKFRSTTSGNVPVDEDLLRTIDVGIPGTAMPAWKSLLPETDRQAVLAYVKGLSARFASEHPVAIAIAEPPVSTVEAVTAGRDVYAKMGCAACHGDGGRGDGPAAPTLKDEAGFPIRPFDFTRAGRMRGGDAPKDVYRTFTTGIDGTPMPSFASNLSEEQRWQLVHYIRSLGKDRPAELTAGPIRAAAVESAVPNDPDDAAWEKAPESVVELRPLWSRDDYVDRLSVRALRSATSVAIRLDWADTTEGRDARGPEFFRDGAAVQLPVAADGPLPFFGMGQTGSPAEIWHWKADAGEVAAARPGLPASGYADTFHGRDKDRAFQTAMAAGNPLALRAGASSADALAATGPGTLTARPAIAQNIGAQGRHKDGRWHVVLSRPLEAAGDASVKLSGRASIPVAFAVWDGAARDRNGQKCISNWETLELGK